MMNSKLEVKLGQLRRLCPQLKDMIEKSLLKMREAQVIDICKVTTTKAANFDKDVPIA